MPHQTGFLDKTGHPAIKIRVYGVAPQLQQEFVATIDTGFSGFLSLPVPAALPLGLTLCATGSFKIADASTVSTLLTIGSVVLEKESETRMGIIVLTGDQPLLGMSFLREFRKTLLVSSGAVLLFDEEEILRVIAGLEQEWQRRQASAVKPE